MKITHLGHACIQITADDGRSILIDPGNLADDISAIPRPEAVLITHGHADHLDPEKIRDAFGTDMPVHAPADAQPAITDAGLMTGSAIADGDALRIAGLAVEVSTRAHEQMYPGVPLPENLSLTIEGRIYHPGDSFQPPSGDVDVLLLPLGAPWMKLSETIDFARAVAPRIILPIHQGGLAAAHRGLHTSLLTRFAPAGAEVVTPHSGVAISI